MALGLPAMAAVGQSSPSSSPVVLGKSAPIRYGGAVVLPYAYVACAPGDFGYLSISLTEKVGTKVTSGSGYDQFQCTGQVETVRVPVTPPSGSPAFVVGRAFGQAQFNDCGYSGCILTQVHGPVNIFGK